MPRTEVMGLIGLLALTANMTSDLILLKYKDGNVNICSARICSRNAEIGNIAVIVAAIWLSCF